MGEHHTHRRLPCGRWTVGEPTGKGRRPTARVDHHASIESRTTGKLDDVCDEDAKVVLADKDTFMNAVRAHHDFHVNMIDQREDALGSEERKRLDAVMAELRVWERERNRSRVEEILGQWKRHNDLVAEVCGDEEDEDEDEDEEDEGARREED